MAELPLKTTTKWGAACAACASAKAKCIRRDSQQQKCERCTRLAKDCTSQVHQPRKKRTSKPSKTAQLEERINGLVDLLRASGEIPTLGRQIVSEHASPAAVLHEKEARVSLPPSPATRQDLPLPLSPVSIPACYNSFAPPTCLCRPESGDIVTVGGDSDDDLLARFRTHMAPLFPFVVLPPTITAAQMAAHRPNLMMAIRAAACIHNVRFMQAQMYALVSHVSEYMLLRAERSFDLLQALLIATGWYQKHCMVHSQMNNLLHLATSLLADLTLNKPPRLAERTRLMAMHPPEPRPRTNEERRVLLGLWYIISCVATCFHKIESLRFTRYIQQCLQEVEDANEYESDHVLVALVRLQHLTEKVASLDSHNELAEDLPSIPYAPVSAYRLAHSQELDRITSGFSAAVKANTIIQNHVLSATLRLCEPPHIELHSLKSLAASLTASSPAVRGSGSGLDVLFRAYDALTAWFEHFFSIPLAMFDFVPLPLCMNLIYAITMLSRWARLAGPIPPPSALRDVRGGVRDAGSSETLVSFLHLKDPSARLVSGLGAGPTPGGLSGTGTASMVSPPPSDATPSASGDGSGSGSGVGEAGSGSTGGGVGASDGVERTTQPLPNIEGKFMSGGDLDPDLKAVLSRLREYIRSQPHLLLDIPAILVSLADRFQELSRNLRAVGAAKYGDSAVRGINIWELTARKLVIMRAKIGRYSDGSTAASSSSGGNQDSSLPEDAERPPLPTLVLSQHQQLGTGASGTAYQPLVAGLEDVGPGAGLAPFAGNGIMDADTPVTFGAAVEVPDFTARWASDMFDHLDPSLWMENMDWMASTTI